VAVVAGVWAQGDLRAEASYREYVADVERARDLARSEVRVVAWVRVPGTEPRRARVTIESTVPGEVAIVELVSSALAARSFASRRATLAPGTPVALEVDLDAPYDAARVPGDRVRLRWLAAEHAIPIRLEACRPACGRPPWPAAEDAVDEATIELPPISGE